MSFVTLNLSITQAIEALEQYRIQPSLAVGGPVHFVVKKEFFTDPLELDLLVIVCCKSEDIPQFIDCLQTLTYSTIVSYSWDNELRAKIRELPRRRFAKEEKADIVGYIEEEDYVFQ